MSALADTPAALARVLDERRLPWFVFGAQAVAVRGAPRATQNLDVTVRLDRDGLPEIIARPPVDIPVTGIRMLGDRMRLVTRAAEPGRALLRAR